MGYNSERSKERILNAAERLFSAHGIDGVSVRQIAAGAGVQLALLTYYFGNKEGLYRAVFERRIAPISATRRARLAAILGRKRPPPRIEEVLDALARPWVELRRHRWGAHYTRLIAREVADPREGSRGIVEDLLDPIAREFIAAMERVLRGQPRARSHWAYHFFIGALLNMLMNPARPLRVSGARCAVADNEALLAEVVGFFAAALRGRPRRTETARMIRNGGRGPRPAPRRREKLMPNPLDNFAVERDAIQYVGHDLQRPECILAERDGTLWVADARGGVVRIAPDGAQRLIAQRPSPSFAAGCDLEARYTQGTLPNGLAFAANGDIVIANFGTDVLELMSREGETRTLHDRIDGAPIGKVNFVLRDSKDRLWITVSTRVNPWTAAVTRQVRDGYIALADGRGLRMVADGFCFTNEIRFDAREEWLYIVETTGPHITRMRARPDGSLDGREIFGPADLGGFPDGIAFDSWGNLWGTLVMADRLFALTPEGELRILLDDGDAEANRVLREHWRRGKATMAHMAAARGTIAPWMASVTFGGADLRTVYIGSLMGTRIPFLRAPVAGLPMRHWKQ